MYRKLTHIVVLLMVFHSNTFSQTVYENQHAKVYEYLSRMSQKGIINLDDLILPMSRNKINRALDSVKVKNDQLTYIEKEELNFYLKEYKTINLDTTTFHIATKDPNNRLRLLSINSKDFKLNVDPIIGDQIIIGNKVAINQVSNGVQLWGNAGKNWGYQLYYRDYTEKGDIRNYYTVNGFSFKRESPTTSIIIVGLNDEKKINYSEVRANINYSFSKGMISFGKDRITWGYAQNGRIVLSDKAPSYPLIRFDYEPIKNLRFNYTHAWLNSNIIDSNQSYFTPKENVSGDQRVLFTPKFLVTHSLTYTIQKGLDVSIGESIIYSDKMDPGFLIPINLFKFYDNNKSNYVINAGSNGQYFLQANSRNQIKNTHLFTTLFIDELRVASMLNPKKARNQIGFTIGGSVTDKFLPYLTLGGEYTRVNPFVYSNLIPAQWYSSYDYSLGDWMGNNFDRLMIYGKYHPIPRLQLYAHLQRIRKGGPGTILQQYTAEPQPRFLFEFQKNRYEVLLKADYEFINNLYLFSSFQWIYSVTYNKKYFSEPIFQLGFSYGLP